MEINTLWKLWSLTQETYPYVQKDRFTISKRKTSHKKAHRLFRRMTHPEGYVQKGDHQKDASHEVPHLQNFFYTFQQSYSKIKYYVIRSKRSADKSEKLVNYQIATFPLLCYFQRLRKKATSSLSSLRPVDQQCSRVKIYKLQ